MKTVLRILLILVVASLVAGAIYLAVGSTTPANMTGSGAGGPEIGGDEGGRDGGPLAGSIAGIIGTLAKLTGITLTVVLLQSLIRRLRTRAPRMTRA